MVAIFKFLQKMVVVDCGQMVKQENLWNQKIVFSGKSRNFLGICSKSNSGSSDLSNSVQSFANTSCCFWIPGKIFDLNAGVELFKIAVYPVKKQNMSFCEWITSKVCTLPFLVIPSELKSGTALFIFHRVFKELEEIPCMLSNSQAIPGLK